MTIEQAREEIWNRFESGDINVEMVMYFLESVNTNTKHTLNAYFTSSGEFDIKKANDLRRILPEVFQRSSENDR